ncbi:MAG: hypothetical protein IKI36_05115 [Prevotella sp.]|nr:hypothetical protein [Prevotella sp.]
MKESLYRLVLGGCALLAVLCLCMLSCVRERVVVSIDGFDLHAPEGVTVGRASDICFDKVPHDFLIIRRTAGGFSWQVNDRWLRSDSLCYFHINGENPNAHKLSESQTIVVGTGRQRTALPVRELDALLSGHESQYVMLRNALEKRRQETGGDQGDFRERREIRSFLYRSKSHWGSLGAWQLVILDRHTTIEGDGTSIGYATADSVANCCKVQFYRLMEYSLMSDSKKLFRIGDVSYLAKPVLQTTAWEAGHAMIREEDGWFTVRYPKPLTYSEDCGILREMTEGKTSSLTLQQTDGSLPVGQSVYIPQFSRKVSEEVCHLTVAGDSLLVAGQRVKSGWSLVPRLSPVEVTMGQARLHLHTAVIGMGLLCSYLWLPLVIFLLIFFAYPKLMDVEGKNIRGMTLWAEDLPRMFRMVSAIALIYCICKVMIAVKLSWTAPYFEKLTGVVVVDSGLLLMLLFSLSVLVNYDFLQAGESPRGHIGWRKWAALLVAVFGVALCFFALKVMDRGFSREVLASYQPGEVFSYNPFAWTKKNGINDLHRSIPYTLLLFNLLTILLLLAHNVRATLKQWQSKGRREERDRVLQHNRKKRWWSSGRISNWVALGVALAFAILVVLATLIPGNFSSAPISLLVILGMGYALMRVDFVHNRVWAFLTSVGVAAMLLIAAVAPSTADKGYFTNCLGLVSLVVLLYVIVSKYDHSPSSADLSNDAKERKIMNILMGMMMLFAVFAVPKIMTLLLDVENVDYDRSPRRFEMASQFDDYRNSGYRYAVSDTEFMMVMVHSMFNADGRDPLSPERHVLHPSVSTGQSPVVLNDVAVPVAFFGTYGWAAYVVYFGLLVLLLVSVVGYCLPAKRQLERGVEIDVRMLWRLLAVLMWVGTSCYLYGSYVGRFPFTGRLNPGFGVDSVGEILESAILLAFMTAVSLRRDKQVRTNQSRL